MFRTINQKFYTIAGALVLLFCINYIQLALFINKEARIATQGADIINFERGIRNVLNQFYRMRYWERIVFSQEFPDAERHFGQAMANIKSQLPILINRSPEAFITGNMEAVSKALVSYEKEFNRLIQLNTEQRLHLTSIESSYQQLASSILNTGNLSYVKPLLIITHFQIGYVRAHQDTEYQALNVVINSLKNKLFQSEILDERLEGYVDGYREVLHKEFKVNNLFKAVSVHFNNISLELTELLKLISERSENLLDDEFLAAEAIRERKKYSFLVSSSLSVIALFVILLIVARKIIRPVRSVAHVIMDIKAGKSSSRFAYTGNQRDDIVQLGLIFNDMLDTLEQKNRQLIDYQVNLEAKIKELDMRQEERETMIGELEAKNAELERFTYTVSHDLKSPLITIRGFLGFLQEDAASGDAQRVKSDIDQITAATEKMQWLLKDLLELSRVGRLINPAEEIVFEEIVTEAVQMVSGHLNVEKVKINVNANRQLLCGDRQRLLEVFGNLIDNALKYSHSQIMSEITIGIKSIGGENVYYVQDNGIGIAPKYHERIFNLFEKLDPTVEGTGVGLAIVKRIIEIHSGRIWVESEGIGCGSTFCFTLPTKLSAKEKNHA
jgi:signal transduction histidine kinase